MCILAHKPPQCTDIASGNVLAFPVTLVTLFPMLHLLHEGGTRKENSSKLLGSAYPITQPAASSQHSGYVFACVSNYNMTVVQILLHRTFQQEKNKYIHRYISKKRVGADTGIKGQVRLSLWSHFKRSILWVAALCRVLSLGLFYLCCTLIVTFHHWMFPISNKDICL